MNGSDSAASELLPTQPIDMRALIEPKLSSGIRPPKSENLAAGAQGNSSPLIQAVRKISDT